MINFKKIKFLNKIVRNYIFNILNLMFFWQKCNKNYESLILFFNIEYIS
jgi:hypothetical protein